jgi:VWFA-related protein
MTRVGIVTLLSVAMSVALVGVRQEPTFRAGTHTVSVYATVVDASGRLVPDLTRGDFEILDSGAPQPLTLFTNDTQPITIVVMLDRSGSMLANFDLERAAAEQFVLHLLPADKARLGSFSQRVQIDPPAFTGDQAELIRILHDDLQPAGPTPLWNAASAAMTALAHETGRRVVLLFTDGQDFPDRPAPNASLAEVRDRAQAEEIMVYAIGLAGACDAPIADLDLRPGQVRFQGRSTPPPPGSPRGGLPIPGRGGPPVPIGGGSPLPPGRGPAGIPGLPGAGGRGGDLIGERPGSPVSPCTIVKPDPGLKLLADQGGGGYVELHSTDNLSAAFARVAEELHHQYLLAFTAPALDGQVHRLDVRVRQPGMTARARTTYLAPRGK